MGRVARVGPVSHARGQENRGPTMRVSQTFRIMILLGSDGVISELFHILANSFQGQGARSLAGTWLERSRRRSEEPTGGCWWGVGCVWGKSPTNASRLGQVPDTASVEPGPEQPSARSFSRLTIGSSCSQLSTKR
jgi:hypothetical protein